MGFNTIRIPFCNEMLLPSSSVSVMVDFNLNPDLLNLSPLRCLDRIILYAGSIGLKVILDRHSAKAGNEWNEGYWYIPNDAYYTEQNLIKDWVMLARRYYGTNVISSHHLICKHSFKTIN